MAILCAFTLVVQWLLHIPFPSLVILPFALLGIVILVPKGRGRALALFPIVYIVMGCVNILISYLLFLAVDVSYTVFLQSEFWSVVTDGVTVVCIWIWLMLPPKKTEAVRLGRKDYLVVLSGAVFLFGVICACQGFMKRDEALSSFSKPFVVCIVLIGLFFFGGLLWQSYMRNKALELESEKALYDQFLEKQETHMKDLLEADERLRSFRHDVRAHLLALESCMEEQDGERMREYMERMKREMKASEREVFCGIAAVDAIVSEWHQKAKEQSIAWEWMGKLPQDVSVDLFDLCIVISNLLSNAVEAAVKVEPGQGRFVKVKIGCLQDRIVVTVANSCLEETAKNRNMKTTKQDERNHGFGMKSIERIIEQSSGQMTRSCENGIFQIRIIV
ncbi:MAG: GHKL domain-containing protein [Lachnospiraceae bacterium]|nr:GHKL domain-containing protein [Lachnospiraceae bacterium]